MQMVRETLGEDAIIVATREERGGRAVRVTAAIEEDMMENASPAFEVGQSGVPASSEDWLQYDEEEQEAAITEELTDIMLRHSVPEDVTDMILSCATLVGLGSPEEALTAALEHLFGFRPLPQKAHRKPLMVVGAPGAGKTLAVAKMAARGIMNDLKVTVITTDTVRAGGVEQLEAFTNILRTPLIKVKNAEELRASLEKVKGSDQVLVDTGGTNPFDKEEIKDLARMLAAGEFDPLLVMPSGMDSEEAGEMSRIYAATGVRWMLPARLDIARRFGGLLEAAHQGGMSFADASNNAQVAEGLTSMTPKKLCNLLMPKSRNNDRAQQKRRTGT